MGTYCFDPFVHVHLGHCDRGKLGYVSHIRFERSASIRLLCVCDSCVFLCVTHGMAIAPRVPFGVYCCMGFLEYPALFLIGALRRLLGDQCRECRRPCTRSGNRPTKQRHTRVIVGPSMMRRLARATPSERNRARACEWHPLSCFRFVLGVPGPCTVFFHPLLCARCWVGEPRYQVCLHPANGPRSAGIK